MKFTIAAAVSAALSLAATAANAQDNACRELSQLKLPKTELTVAEVAAGSFTPPAGGGPGGAAAQPVSVPFCRVSGVVEPAIRFEVWLPQKSAWNGRYQAVGGGGFAGVISYPAMTAALQAKLLRVLEGGQFERVGEERTRRVDVRIIAATNRDLESEVEAGRFRRDLYYRLSLFPIEVPPLRDRKDDIPLLAAHFLRLASQRLNRPAPGLTASDLEMLQQYDWPGNVRELAHVMERAVILTDGRELRVRQALALARPRPGRPGAATGSRTGKPAAAVTDAEMRRLEQENIQLAMDQAGGKIYGRGGAAELLGLKPTTLTYRMKTLGIRPR